MPASLKLFVVTLLLALASGLSHANEAVVRKAVQSLIGPNDRIESIRRSGALDFYEVQVNGELLYVDAKGRYALLGSILDIQSQRNLTQERKAVLSRINFSELPLHLAAKQVRGKGRRVLATFEDPNCSYCRKLALELEKLDDVTVYTFLLPILSDDSAEKSRAIWCAKDRGRAWRDWIIDGKLPPSGRCDAPIDKLQALGRKYNITGTPNIFFSDGNRLGGYAPVAQLEAALRQASQAKH